MQFHDRLTLDTKARRLGTGELAANVRCAKVGLQDYAGHEVGRPDLQRVTVYRPESEVMKRDSFASFAGVPVTVDHPSEAVTTDNWRKYAVGETGDEIVRDGEFVRVPILVRDEAAIRAIQDGKRQISMGYSASLDFVDGVTPDGKPYQAIQREIRINHLAIVDEARGGPLLTVDAAQPSHSIYRPGLLDGRNTSKGETTMQDAKTGIAQARASWANGKANSYRDSRQSAMSGDAQPVADAKIGLADARNARLARLSNAYRG
jgi:hypothetical protein